LSVEGLREPVEIVRDRWGVPHIYAANNHDLFFAQGYVHAQDRLFQMDVSRRLGAGRLSEVVGSLTLASDRFARYFGWPRVAEAQVRGASEETRAMCAAYSAGANAYMNTGRLPVEFAILAYRPEPWQHLDTGLWGSVLAWGLSVNWETEILRARLIAALGAAKAAALTPTCDDTYHTVLPSERIGQRQVEEIWAACQEAERTGLVLPVGTAPAGDLPRTQGLSLSFTRQTPGNGAGSNNWVVSGGQTKSGRPVLANDPHLPPTFPALWYENHLEGGDYSVAGFTMPGVPGVVIGHNQQIAWGVTNGFPDVQDVFVERFDPQDPRRYERDGEWVEAEVVAETIRVRGRRPVVENVRYTRHGPVFSDLLPEEDRDLALGWTSYADSDHVRTVLEMNKASNWTEFRQALRYWSFPSQNVVYADTDGNIGYMLPGLIPQRGKGQGIVPAPGWDSSHDWQGWIPFEQLPVLFNPPSGKIVTANNRVHGSDYPFLLSSEWLADYRARRIDALLEEKAPLGLLAHAEIQQDIVSPQALRFLARALPIANSVGSDDPQIAYACRILGAWHGEMRADRVAPSICFGWATIFADLVMKQALGLELASELLGKPGDAGILIQPIYGIAAELSLRWLESSPPDWVGDIRRLLIPALRQTLQALRQKFGANPNDWQWGNLHRVRFAHPLARIPGLSRLWKPVELPVAGDGYTINQSDVGPQFPPDPVTIVASCRLILDVGAWDNSLAALPGGQSGHVSAEQTNDGLSEWYIGHYHPMCFSRERVDAAAADTLWLIPPSSESQNPSAGAAEATRAVT
jgi:penicillin amidase